MAQEHRGGATDGANTAGPLLLPAKKTCPPDDGPLSSGASPPGGVLHRYVFVLFVQKVEIVRTCPFPCKLMLTTATAVVHHPNQKFCIGRNHEPVVLRKLTHHDGERFLGIRDPHIEVAAEQIVYVMLWQH